MWTTANLTDDPIINNQLLPLTYSRSPKEFIIGISTIAERWQAIADQIPPDCFILSACLPSPALVLALRSLETNQSLYHQGQWIAFKNTQNANSIELKESPHLIQFPEDLLKQNNRCLAQDIQANIFDLVGLRALGNTILAPEHCYIDPTAILKGSILDASTGPIYVGPGVILQIGTCIQGPAALLANVTTNIGAKIRPFTTIGSGCKIGGEISASLFFPYSNKSHDGFIGNSIIGSFCNLGAGTTSSNVRNDLQAINLYNYPTNATRKTQITSFGVLMGDHVRTGIATKINTGSVIGSFCNVSSEQFLPKFTPSFTWGEFPRTNTYEKSKALVHAKAWIAAKNLEIPEKLTNTIEQIWKAESNIRN